MINNVNPATSKLFEQIKRLSTPPPGKEDNHIDFENDAMKNCTHNVNSPKGANLLNTIERIQKKNDIPIQTLENTNKEGTGKNIQTSEWPKPINAEKNIRKEPVGSFLDIYL
ncbi:MAG: hypothetical protein HUU08_04825 [Candidatus Brocadia sp.]|nr:hypothetical protein [Candidatus Brocadia sp.]